MTGTIRREVARCVDFDLTIEDHGFLVLSGHFEMESGVQGLGYMVDAEFLHSFLSVWGGGCLSKVNGLMCYITADHDRIHKIEPLNIGTHIKGTAFDIDAWAERKELQRDEGAKDRLVETAIKNNEKIKKIANELSSNVEQLRWIMQDDSLSIKKFVSL